jgi:anti-anti-sigma factor
MMVAPVAPGMREREIPMLLRVEMVGTVAVLTLTDTKLDATNLEDFVTEVDPVIKQSPRLLLDLHKVEFVDSTGCSAILQTVAKLRPINGQLVLCAAKPRIHDTFTLVGLHRTCDMYGTVDEGLKAFGVTGQRGA